MAMRVSPFLITIVAGLTPVGAVGSSAQEGVGTIERYVHCAAGRGFGLQVTARTATVSIDGQIIRLLRRPSSIGFSYASAEGSMIIDGQFVALVLADDIGLDHCEIGEAHAVTQTISH